jgi:hypothetical protein
MITNLKKYLVTIAKIDPPAGNRALETGIGDSVEPSLPYGAYDVAAS